jgi:hypothetical protein
VKKLLLHVLIITMLLAGPALAQEGASKGDPANSPPSGPSPDRTATLSSELAVEGELPAGTEFFGFIPAEGGISTPLTDPDGAGVYTGSTPPDLTPAGGTQPALIVQGTGTWENQVVGTSPGEPISTIEDFGEVKFEEDTMLRASVSFEDSGGSGGGFLANAADSVRGLLPSTGSGAALAVLGVGILLILSGLAVRRIFR